MNNNDSFCPDWASPPGETVADILEEQSITIREFARRIGHTIGQVKELLDGRAPITNTTAQKLEISLGVPAAFWVTREAQYRQDLARIQASVRSESSESSEQWLAELPIGDMIKFGWIPKAMSASAQAEACLRFFGVASVGEWRSRHLKSLESSAFRTSPSFRSQQGAVAAWLRQGEIESAEIACHAWSPKCFEAAIPHIRTLTRKKDPEKFVPELASICAECGVAVAVVRAPTGCRASGATRFLSPSKALLLLSFRHLSDDHFWFTFFHEAGHLLLHGEKGLFLDGLDASMDKDEEEANQFAAEALIPPQFQKDLLTLRADSHEIIRFSRLIGVSPGIVVGQLQHLKRIKYNELNSLKRRFQWK
ncbi:XRE family transcriptional regulator [Sorangium cellulosum]|uniref:XRE family transcriptional regulator n=1 Tax=Sorangium cellulosum TaxID=56 RepID=A0A2L0F7K4_SORCE|nr:ImmA/IrrE family metallo-endopeptidase [Sorangium cellulosum]AUX47584.1 XRE family transcriptional regulator [Sorangium cellulosum]